MSDTDLVVSERAGCGGDFGWRRRFSRCRNGVARSRCSANEFQIARRNLRYRSNSGAHVVLDTRKTSERKGRKVSSGRNQHDTFSQLQSGKWELVFSELLELIERVRYYNLMLGERPHHNEASISMGFCLARCATHSTRHPGQIVALREVLGLWNADNDVDEDHV